MVSVIQLRMSGLRSGAVFMEVTDLTPQRMVKWLPSRKFHGQSLLGHKERLKIGGSLSFPSPSSGWFTAWLQATPKHRIISLKAQLKSGARATRAI